MKKYKIIIFLIILIFSMGTAYASDINGTLESTTDNSVADSLYTFTDLANSITDSN